MPCVLALAAAPARAPDQQKHLRPLGYPQATNAAVTDLYSSGKRYNGMAIVSAIAAGVALAVGVPLFFATQGSTP